jgi:DNA-binding CsgD family transcriptional regulator/GAF domain-containing protein
VKTDLAQRAHDRLARVAGQGMDLVGFWRACTPVLAEVVPHYHAPCWHTLDPASLLITSHFDEGIPEVPPEWLAAEYLEDDVNKLADVARTAGGVQTLHEVTGGDPSRTPRWQANIELGADQELIAALRTRGGEVWGAIGLYREPDQPLFDRDEIAFVRTVSPLLAAGARRALLVGEANDPEEADSPGLVVVDERLSVESTTPGVERWLADLPGGAWERRVLPPAITAVAASALASIERPASAGELAMARVRARSGMWVVLHGAVMGSGDTRRIAVIVEPARGARVSGLLMSAYGLTERERDVTRAVLQGASTAEIAEQLVVSAHTVQQHLKSIFDKTGVHSRRDLVGKVFFAHYEPRLRDNERRTANGHPARGGPLAP